jgi:hypothetical protein
MATYNHQPCLEADVSDNPYLGDIFGLAPPPEAFITELKLLSNIWNASRCVHDMFKFKLGLPLTGMALCCMADLRLVRLMFVNVKLAVVVLKKNATSVSK